MLTGAPGSGKTSVLRLLRERGYDIVDEAATDVIAAEQARGVDVPWARPGFIDAVVALQRRRQLAAATAGEGFQLVDRSPVCTLALALHLGFAASPALAEELDRIAREEVYERRVVFVAGLGFVTPTAGRRISHADALLFERLHRETYTALGYELVELAPAPVEQRADAVEALLRAW